MTTETECRILLEQARNALDVSRRFVYQDSRPQVDAAFDALNTELAKPVEQAEPVAWLYSVVPGHRSAASCERIPLDMTPRGTAEAPLYLHPPTPAWHDAPTCAGWWVRNSHEGIGVYSISEPSIKILKGSAARWYGPIPQDGGKS